MFKTILKNLAHVAAVTAATKLALLLQAGAPITIGTVISAIVATGSAIIGAVIKHTGE